MPNPIYYCPLCRTAGLKCRRTRPDYGSAVHDLELARQSVWFCAACGQRFVLDTPPGKLRKLPPAQEKDTRDHG